MRLSSHLDQLAGKIYDVEQTLGDALTSTSTQTTSITRFQALDFVRQSLEDCSLLIHFLSALDAEESAMHADQLVHIEKKLKLDTTKALVIAKTNDVHSGLSARTDKGEVDLF